MREVFDPPPGSAAPGALPAVQNFANRMMRWPSSRGANFPLTPPGQQLQQVARMLEVAPHHGISRPVIIVLLGGFATSSDHGKTQARLFAELSGALGSFYRELSKNELARRMTVFTDTECNRTLTVNRSGRTGPAWGGHNLVRGGAVLGGHIHGSFPTLHPGSADDADGKGTWFPSTAKAQFAATLANWYRDQTVI